MTILISGFQICMNFFCVITTCREIGKIVSKIPQNAIWPNFDTISKISQSVVITQVNLTYLKSAHQDGQLDTPKPYKIEKNIFSWEGSSLWICKFKNFRAASRTSSNELKFLLVVPRVISHGKNHSAFLISKVSAKWLTLFDGFHHWIEPTERNAKGHRVRRNCKMCLIMGKKDAKAMKICGKCGVPLHPDCFKAYHMPGAQRFT